MVVEVAGEPDVFVEAEVRGQSLQVGSRVAVTDEDAETVDPTQVVDEHVKGIQEVLDAVLIPHDSEVSDDRRGPRPQALVAAYGLEIFEIGAIPNDRDPSRRDASAPRLDLSVGLVRGDDAVRQAARDPFQDDQELEDDPPRARPEARDVHLRGDVVVIEDESFSEQELVDRADQDERVRRVVRMDDVESMATENPDRELQRHKRRVNVLEDVSERSLRPDAPVVAIDVHPADGLTGWLCPGREDR